MLFYSTTSKLNLIPVQSITVNKEFLNSLNKFVYYKLETEKLFIITPERGNVAVKQRNRTTQYHMEYTVYELIEEKSIYSFTANMIPFIIKQKKINKLRLEEATTFT